MTTASEIERAVVDYHRLNESCSARQHREASRRLWSLRYQACKEFAASRGWYLSRRMVTLNQLQRGRCVRAKYTSHYPEIDHEQGFTVGRGWGTRIVGIVSHAYCSFDACKAFADKHGLNVERLPFSWYWPSNCVAVLYTRRD